MNPLTVARVATAIAEHLVETAGPAGVVVVGGDARHGSQDFVTVVCAALASHGLSVVTPGHPAPTPVVAAAVRARGACAGIQVTASHNPPTDNGLKLFGDDGAQIVPPTDADVEARISRMLDADTNLTLIAGAVTLDRLPGVTVDPGLVDDYVRAVTAALPRVDAPLHVALTPLHGVGGETARRVLADRGVTDVSLVPGQATPDPDFGGLASPNPENPGAVAALLDHARDLDADAALALDPDADRCAMGVRLPDGTWRMLDGDEAGILLADFLLRRARPGSSAPVVASTIVSSRLPSLLVPARGGRHAETLTGFKWLVRAPGPLLYAYEEAVGHSVAPDVVADKDGISAAAMWCALLASLHAEGSSPLRRLDEIHDEFGTHVRSRVTVRLDAPGPARGGETAAPSVDLPSVARRVSDGLAESGFSGAGAGTSGTVSPLVGTAGLRVEVPSGRAVIRPSGTEPVLKAYLECWTAPHATAAEVADARDRCARLEDLVARATSADG